MIIRHGDPDYKMDSLTDKGWREAEYLSEMLSKQNLTHIYVSPYGRARDTASLTLKKMNRKAEILPWLREFDAMIFRPDDPVDMHIPWDWLPQDWTKDPKLYHRDHWFENEYMAAYDVGQKYHEVTEQFDALLARRGYRREGGYYRAEKPNHNTIALFCHFGSGGLLLSHLFGVSPMLVWQNFCAQPSSVTTLVTEERRSGIASFRMLAYGDISHLFAHEEPPAFAGRFCECFDDDTRHD